MCGIYCSLCLKKDGISDAQKDLLERRGPDGSNCIKFQLGNLHLLFHACVLHMQGSTIATQPATSATGNILLYTGEIFDGFEVSENDSDTSVLLQLLDECSTTDDLQNILSAIEGPWSLIYYHKQSQTLWFGRDYFGRRSLLISLTSDRLLLSSVTKRPSGSTYSWNEIPTGIHSIKLMSVDKNNFTINTIPWLSVVSKQPKIDFPNLDFFDVSSKCWLTSRTAKRLCNVEQYNYISIGECGVVEKADPISRLVRACEAKNLWPDCKRLIDLLEKAVLKRTRTLTSWNGLSKVGVLFSGGVDCTVLALLADKILPKNEPIDLLNVAFEQTKQLPVIENSNAEKLKYAVPDRITGLNSYVELKALSPNRQWNFVEINIPLEKLKEMRSDHIADLTYPKQTVLDDSIGCALWFASRGKGLVVQNDVKTQYTSTARILLCGMGADEQLGGYSRHRTVFQRSSNWNAVDNEIKMEIDRISSRNLGRDDRYCKSILSSFNEAACGKRF